MAHLKLMFLHHGCVISSLIERPQIGIAHLNAEVFGVEYRPDILNRVVEWQRSRWWLVCLLSYWVHATELL